MTGLDIFEALYTAMSETRSEHDKQMLHSIKAQLSIYVEYLNGHLPVAYANRYKGMSKN